MTITESIERIYVTKNFGRTLDNLELLWFIRDEAERRLSQHINGVHLSADEWAAVNTPDEAWETVAGKHGTPPEEWRKFKEDWFAEGRLLVDLARLAQRNVRIATGHEPVKNLKPVPVTK